MKLADISNWLKKRRDELLSKTTLDERLSSAYQRLKTSPYGQIGQRLQPFQSYRQQVQKAKQTPFFNRENTPFRWAGKVVQDIKKRGVFEGLQDLTYPITKNPYIKPLIEPSISKIRVANYKAGRPIPLINSLLGMTDSQMANKYSKSSLDRVNKILATFKPGSTAQLNLLKDTIKKILQPKVKSYFQARSPSQAIPRLQTQVQNLPEPPKAVKTIFPMAGGYKPVLKFLTTQMAGTPEEREMVNQFKIPSFQATPQEQQKQQAINLALAKEMPTPWMAGPTAVVKGITPQLARDILKVKPNATEAEINTAYKKLITKEAPRTLQDLATKYKTTSAKIINQAKDILLKGFPEKLPAMLKATKRVGGVDKISPTDLLKKTIKDKNGNWMVAIIDKKTGKPLVDVGTSPAWADDIMKNGLDKNLVHFKENLKGVVEGGKIKIKPNVDLFDKKYGVKTGENLLKEQRETFSQMLKREGIRVKPEPKLPLIENTQQAKNVASLKAMAGEGRGFKGLSSDLQDAYRTWVNQRQASRVEGYFKSKEFSGYDKKGMKGIFEVQAGKGGYQKVRSYYDTKFKQVEEAGIPINYRQDYLPQLWANTREEIAQAFKGRFLSKKPSFTIDRVIEDYKAGIKFGLTPKFNKVSDLVGWYEKTANKSLADQGFFKYLAKENMIMSKRNAPIGWQALDVDRFPVKPIKTAEGVYTGAFYAPPELAKIVNNYLRQPEGVITNIANYASTMKNIILSTGVPKTAINFHGFNILARNVLSAKNPIEGLATGIKYMVRPGLAQKDLIARSKIAQLGAKYGLQISTEDHLIGMMEKQVRRNLGQRGFGKIIDFANWIDKPLFQQVIPSLKVKKFEIIYNGFKQSGMSGKESARRAADLTNNIFGGINWEQFGRSRDLNNFLRSSVLAPDWVETNIRMAKGIGASLVKPGTPEAKTYHLIVRNLMFALAAANVVNKVFSGKWMWENDAGHTFEVQAGYTNDGKKRYIRPFGTAVDFIRLPYDIAMSLSKKDVGSIIRVVRNRLSVPVSTAVSLLSNVDYRGRPIYGKDMPVLQQIGGIASQLSRLGTPPYVSALTERATGRIGNEEMISQLLELPTRYMGGAYTNLQKQVEPIAQGAKLVGKELYDFRDILRGESKLSEKQMAYASAGVENVKQIIQSRVAKREENKTKEEIEKSVSESGESQITSGKFYYFEDGSVKSIDLDFEVKPLLKTGNEQIDKKAVSAYKSAITKTANDIYKLYELGYLTADEAEKLLTELDNKYQATKKGKKGSISAPKFKAPTIKVSKQPSFKMPEPFKIKVADIATPQIKPLTLPRISGNIPIAQRPTGRISYEPIKVRIGR